MSPRQEEVPFFTLFYTVALLIWTLYDFITTGQRGIEFLILMIGVAIFFWTRVYYKRKIHN
ncbi:hypothetical protein FA002_24035 [Priestia megaterium]|nr:hypothetical protein FA002_24035 [Priestia megaterium]